MFVKPADRLSRMGSAIFGEVAEWKRQAAAGGLDVIDLGIGSPDLPPSLYVRDVLAAAIQDPVQYGYPQSEGDPLFRRTAAEWLLFRFGAAVDPDSEIVTLMGTQDGLAHLALALCNPGDAAFVPDPGYPIYAAGLALAGVEAIFLPLREENGYLPVLANITAEQVQRAKFILLSYPSNPISAVADRRFFGELVAFARRTDLLIVHDLAYSELAFDGLQPLSILEIDGAKDVAVEFHSLSKSFNLAGCRIGYMAGNRDAVAALRLLKANIDYGVFNAVQTAGIAALREDMAADKKAGKFAAVYQRRRDLFLDRLASYGWQLRKPAATMFVWANVPVKGWTSRQFAQQLLAATGVAVIPGDAFGSQGEGYVRIALVQDEQQLIAAADRIGGFVQKLAEKVPTMLPNNY